MRMIPGLHSQLIVICFILVALFAFGLTAAAWRRSRSPGSLVFALMMLVVVIWIGATAFQEFNRTLGMAVLARKIATLSISWVGTLWLAFTLEYVFPERNYLARYGFALSIPPLINIAITMTNELHGFVWGDIAYRYIDGQVSLSVEHGWWFWVFVVYNYLTLAAGCITLFQGMHRFPRSHRKQAVGLLIGMAIPWLMNLVFMLQVVPGLRFDITPYGLALTGLVYAWTVVRLKLFDLSPLLHEFILENIGEGYLVVDAKYRVVEVNKLAATYLGLNTVSYWGKPVDSILADWPQLLELIHSASKSPVEIPVGVEQPQYLEATQMDWYEGQKRKAGCIILLRDVTRRRLAEENLRSSERLYRLVVNTLPVGTVITDDVGRITFASPQISEIFANTDQLDVVGDSVLKYIHPDERGMGMMRLLKIIEEKQKLPAQEYHFLRPDGSVFWGEVVSTPMLDDSGVSKGLLAIIRDVTQRKELEVRLQTNLEHQTLINRVLQTIYRSGDVLSALEDVIEQTAAFAKADRLYLCKNSVDGSETSIVIEWCNVGIPLRAKEGALFRYEELPTWQERLKTHAMLLEADVMNAPEDIAIYMAAWNVLSMVVFPIYASEERLFGFLALDYCEELKTWNDEELDTLWNLCRIVSGAVAQHQVEEAEKRQRLLAEVLHDTAGALNSTLNLEEVLDRILISLEKLVPHKAASIALVDDDGIVSFVRWRGYDVDGDDIMRKLRIRASERPSFRTMAETGEPLIISDTWLEKTWSPIPEYEWIRAYAGMPIKVKGKVVGFINLDHSEPDSFAPDLIYSLHVYADQAAIALENARLYDATNRRAEELSILYRIGLTMTAGLEMNQILISLFEQCRLALPIDAFYVALYDAATGNVEMPLLFEDGQFIENVSQNINENPGITSVVIHQRKTVYIPDTINPEIAQAYDFVRIGNVGKTSRSYVAVPLLLLNQVVGVISMQNYEPYAYSVEQVRLLETIATQAAIAVQNARIYDQMKQMAITDSVTQLFTRRHFTMLGSGEVERAHRYNRNLGVLMVDIDRFKRINDTYGHSAGDQVLLAVANACRQALRLTDLVGRWGGEEYAIVLPEADLEGAALIAERVRRMVSETGISIGDDQVFVTISIGVAALSTSSRTLEALIDCADHALYAAKQNGRNQVQKYQDLASE